MDFKDALPEKPKIATAPLSVVLVSCNAGNDLRDIVLAWSTLLDGLARDYEIIVVDEASTDGTGAAAELLRNDFPRLQVFRQVTRRGVGAALRIGITAARHPLLFYTTCNKQFQPPDLIKLLDAIDRADVVTGYRVGRPTPGWYAVLRGLNYIFARVVFGLELEVQDCWLGRQGWGRRMLAWWLLRLHTADSECMYRLCRRAIFERIPLQSEGIFSQIEILAKANFLGLYIAEVPVTYLPQRGWDDNLGVVNARQANRRDIWRVLNAADFGPAQPAQSAPPLEANPAG